MTGIYNVRYSFNEHQRLTFFLHLRKHNLTTISNSLDSIGEQNGSGHDQHIAHEQVHPHAHRYSMSSAEALRHGSINPLDLQTSERTTPPGLLNPDFRRHSGGSSDSNDDEEMHVPHALCKLILHNGHKA